MGSEKILIELHYWHGDIEMMRRLVKLITAIEPVKNERADILLTARYDTEIDHDLVAYLSSTFHTYLCPSPWIGSGEGNCYSWFASMNYALQGYRFGAMPEYKAILTADADCVPLTRDWIDRLHSAWDSSPGVLQVGAVVEGGEPPEEHVNSNALWSGKPEHLTWFLNQIVQDKFSPWFDLRMAANIRANGGYTNCSGMRSYWRQPSFTQEQYDKEVQSGTFFVHGVRDFSLLDFAAQGMGVSV